MPLKWFKFKVMGHSPPIVNPAFEGQVAGPQLMLILGMNLRGDQKRKEKDEADRKKDPGTVFGTINGRYLVSDSQSAGKVAISYKI